jgi:gamma-glutamyltranspeptidase/glutathione hydrolase
MHALYQAMNMAFADRDFYYGDPYVPPVEPIKGLLSKDYAKSRFQGIDWAKNDPNVKPGDPYPFQGEKNPFAALLAKWTTKKGLASVTPAHDIRTPDARSHDEGFYAGTTSVQAADEEGWLVSVTPSGGWVPAVIAGKTGIGLSQRMQAFVLDEADCPFNVVRPGQRPRSTLTPSIAIKDGAPYLAFSVQGGDSQDQNLLQFFLNMVEFGMNVQQACEAPNINSFQMRSTFDQHLSEPGRMLVAESTPPDVRKALQAMGYTLTFSRLTSGPITAIMLDRKHGTMWGGASNHGEDYGIGW